MAWREHVPQVWTASQRIALVGLLIMILVYLGARLLRDREDLPEILPPIAPRAGELVDAIDPNPADAAALAAIPHIGEKKAADIVAYRDHFLATTPQRRPFERIEDLYHVRGMGPGTVAQIRQYLRIGVPSTRNSVGP